jgi:hypothetical protein
MPQFDVAHIREQGIDLIIVPLDDAFDIQSDQDQRATIRELQVRATSAGLAGVVVPVWQSGASMKFIAPTNWHAYFQSISLDFVIANVNRQLSW